MAERWRNWNLQGPQSVPVSSHISEEHENHLFFDFNKARSFSHRRFDWHFYPIKLIITSQSTDVLHNPDQKKGHSNPRCSIISWFTEQMSCSFILKRIRLLKPKIGWFTATPSSHLAHIDPSVWRPHARHADSLIPDIILIQLSEHDGQFQWNIGQSIN